MNRALLVRSLSTRGCLTALPDDGLSVEPQTGSDDQLWEFQPSGDLVSLRYQKRLMCFGDSDLSLALSQQPSNNRSRWRYNAADSTFEMQDFWHPPHLEMDRSLVTLAVEANAAIPSKRRVRFEENSTDMRPLIRPLASQRWEMVPSKPNAPRAFDDLLHRPLPNPVARSPTNITDEGYSGALPGRSPGPRITTVHDLPTTPPVTAPPGLDATIASLAAQYPRLSLEEIRTVLRNNPNGATAALERKQQSHQIVAEAAEARAREDAEMERAIQASLTDNVPASMSPEDSIEAQRTADEELQRALEASALEASVDSPNPMLRGQSFEEQLAHGVAQTDLILNLKSQCPLSVLRDECKFNRHMCSKIDSMTNRYNGYRAVRGDGNCYYRAVGFSFLERAFVSAYDGVPRLRAFISKCRKANLRGHEEAEASRELLVGRIADWCDTATWRWTRSGVIQECRAESPEVISAALEKSFVEDEAIDKGLVRMLRHVTSSYIREHQHDPMPGGMTYEEAVILGMEFPSLEAYFEEMLEKMGEDAAAVVHVALPAATGIAVRMEYLDRSNAQTTFDFPEDDAVERLAYIVIRPGHFDILYPRVESSFQL